MDLRVFESRLGLHARLSKEEESTRNWLFLSSYKIGGNIADDRHASHSTLRRKAPLLYLAIAGTQKLDRLIYTSRKGLFSRATGST